MAGLLPLIVALLLIEAARQGRIPRADDISSLLPLSLLVFTVLTALVSRVLLRWRPMWLHRWDDLGTGLLLAAHGWWCFGLGWAGSVSLNMQGLAPFLLGLIIHWMILAPGRGYRRRRESVLLRSRLTLAPILALIGIIDLVTLAWTGLSKLELLPAGIEAALVVSATILAPVLLLGLLPPLIVRLWGARPIDPAGLGQRLGELADRAGVRVGAMRLWPSKPGHAFYNAAVLGLWPRFRQVVISEDLVKALPDEQVDAVIGHELGHARHGHLWLYLVFLLGVGLWSGMLTDAAAGAFDLGIITATILWIGLWLVGLRVGFGYLSRRCERQADLAGAELSGDPAHMAGALRAVALLSGESPERPNWRHYSIAQRVRFLEQTRLDPGTVPWHHRTVMRTRALLLIMLAVGLGLSLMMSQPRPELSALRSSDSSLDRALGAAKTADNDSLENWLITADSHARQEVGSALYLWFSAPERVNDSRVLYEYRGWLAPFARVPTGNGDLDILLINCLAYGLAAGTAEPSETEIALALRLVDRLKAAATRLESPAIMDTVGSVYHVTGDFPKAVVAFEETLRLLEAIDLGKLEEERAKVLKEFKDLAQRRLAAAHNQEALPLDWPEDAQPAGGGGSGSSTESSSSGG